ncbi:histidine kinase [Tellurirhabdus rosea]|uniref:histidine kinase n=1 Tax=Tellurirhabdus rosea TaxID=2674997 RepID=UPI0022521237|nr:sensor histidine kinase [Tellurirhabdus rosea]
MRTLLQLGWWLVCLLTAPRLLAYPNVLPYEFTAIQEQQGLSNNFVTNFFQDRDGFLWVATGDGLNRFDGSHFTTYRRQHHQPNSLGNGFVHDICQDRQGRLWLATENGISQFDPATQRFQNFFSVNGQPLGMCSNIVCDHDGNLWFTTRSTGLYRYRIRTGRFDFFPASGETLRGLQSTASKNGLLVDPQRPGLWLATYSGLHYLDIRTGAFFHARHNPQKLPIFNGTYVSALTLDSTGRLIFADNGQRKVIIYDLKTRRIERAITLRSATGLSEFPLATIFVDRNRNLWTSSWTYTLFHIAADTYRPTEFFHRENQRTSIPAQFFWSGWQHPDGSVWLATANGIAITNPERTFYRVHDLERAVPNINQYFGITSLTDAGDSWWLTTPYYLLHYFPAAERLERYPLPVQENVDYAYHRPQTLFSEDQQTLFIRFSSTLYRFDVRRKTFTPLPIPPDLPGAGQGLTYLYRQGDYLWAFGYFPHGLRLHLPTGRWQSFPICLDPGAAAFSVVMASYSAGTGLWLDAPFNGLFRFSEEQQQFVSVKPKGMLSGRTHLFGLAAGEGHTLWLLFPEDGLGQYDTRSGTYRFREVPEWGSVHPQFIAPITDRAGRIWSARYNKFSVFSPDLKQHLAFSLSLNEPTLQYLNYLLPLRNGRVLAAMKGFLVEFFPEKIASTTPPARPLISSVSPTDTTFLIHHQGTKVSLAVGQNNFSINYSILTSRSGDYQYRYRLEGYDEKWVEAGTRTTANYTKIPGGDYVFCVRAVADGVELPETRLAMHVDIEFYRTVWFQLLLVLGILGGIGTFVWVIYRSQTQQTERLHHLQMQATRLQRDKTEIQYQNLINHLNPHFLFNSLTSVSSLIIIDPEQASEFLQKLSAIYRYILQNKEKEAVSLEYELAFVQHYISLQKSRFEDGLQITLQVPELYLSRGIVPVTLQNLFENAIKHNTIEDEKPLFIRVYVEEPYLCVANSLQKKNFVETSNRQGLESLKALYSYLSDLPIVIGEQDGEFVVKVPLL